MLTVHNESNVEAELAAGQGIISTTTADAAVTGEINDLQTLGFPGSGALIVQWDAALTAETIAAIVTLYHDTASNMGTEALYATVANGTVVQATATGANVKGCYSFPLNDLHGCKRYVRAKVTLTTSGAGTFTAWSAAIAFGGFRISP